MFTGIIETNGKIEAIFSKDGNKSFIISSSLSNELKVDQSVSHDGVCLTVEKVSNGTHQVTAIEETLSKTNIGTWLKDTIVNIERCMQVNGRLDGHIVQGHVDGTAKCMEVVEKDGSRELRFAIDRSFAPLIIEKGSICVNGISLTCFNISESHFTVAIIPYTLEHTNIKFVKTGDIVNIEFDILGKYVQRIAQLNTNPL